MKCVCDLLRQMPHVQHDWTGVIRDCQVKGQPRHRSSQEVHIMHAIETYNRNIGFPTARVTAHLYSGTSRLRMRFEY